MKYTEEEILSYARSQIRYIDQQKGKRSVLGLMGIGVIVIFVCLIQMIKKKSEETGTDLLLDEKFLSGIAISILIFLCLGISAVAVVRMFSTFYGKEIEVYRLLVRLNDERSGYPPKSRDPTTSEGEG
jgi:hypothetical protein